MLSTAQALLQAALSLLLLVQNNNVDASLRAYAIQMANNAISYAVQVINSNQNLPNNKLSQPTSVSYSPPPTATPPVSTPAPTSPSSSTSPPVYPRILMFDGADIRYENNPDRATYWGNTVGVQGLILDSIMWSWKSDVGTDEQSSAYQQAKQFQQTYAAKSVTDNFIKTALYDSINWNDAAERSRVVENFRRAAKLAKYAGMKGIALDFEAYTPDIWTTSSTSTKATLVRQVGHDVGVAIASEYPGISIIVLPETFLSPLCSPGNICNLYATATDFWNGLTETVFGQIIIGTETTYYYFALAGDSRSTAVLDDTRQAFVSNLNQRGISTPLYVSAGLWPLGNPNNYTDKTKRCTHFDSGDVCVTPTNFHNDLLKAVNYACQYHAPYVWIYGHGAAWNVSSQIYPGAVDSQFSSYTNEVRTVPKTCSL